MGLDEPAIEAEFRKLLERGWPAPVAIEHAEPRNVIEAVGVLNVAFAIMAAQLVQSSVPETCAYWRAKLGMNKTIPALPNRTGT